MAQAYTSVLKFNVDGRPYVKDIHDLFSALVTQVKFSSHKYLFTSYENTMTSEDILEVLSNLQFIQSISLPDSEGQGRLNTTITTTTFNMQRGVAKALCQQFIWARLIYNATDPLNRSYRDKALWKLTMKGLIILHEFCQLLDMNHLLLSNDKISIEEYRLLTLERNEDDQLITSRSNMISLFRIMIHALSEDENGLLLSKHTNRDNTIVHKIKKKRNNRHNQQQKIRKQQQQLRKSSLTSSSSISSSSTTSSCMKNGYPPQHYYNQQRHGSKRSSVASSINSSTSSYTGLTTPQSSPSSMIFDSVNYASTSNTSSYFSSVMDKFNFYDTRTSSTYSNRNSNGDIISDIEDEESEEEEYEEEYEEYEHGNENEDEDEAQESEEEYTVIRKMRVIFTSQVCCDWLSASCSIACRDEAELLSTEFLRHGWIRFYKESYQEELNFVSSSKDIFLSVTPKGRQLVIDGIHSSTSYSTSTITSPSYTPLTTPVTPTTPVFTFHSPSSRRSSANLEDPSSSSSPCYLTHPLDQQKELKETPNSHSAKLMAILKDPHLRSLFKDFLKANYCVENLDFWIDYHHLKTKCKNQSPALNKQYQKDLLEDAIAIWAKYLSPKAKHELNIDHGLQKELKQYIKSIVKFEYSSTSITSSSSLKKKDRYASYTNLVYISTQSNAQCLRTILKRFDCVELQICRLMASDSVPKFVSWLRTAKKNDKINLLQQNLQSLKL